MLISRIADDAGSKYDPVKPKRWIQLSDVELQDQEIFDLYHQSTIFNPSHVFGHSFLAFNPKHGYWVEPL